MGKGGFYVREGGIRWARGQAGQGDCVASWVSGAPVPAAIPG